MSFAKKARYALISFCALITAACASLNVSLPSITESPTGERLPGKIIWRDLLTNDPVASREFYSELFGWEFESVGKASNLRSNSAYTLIRHNGNLIGGMVDTLALNNRDDISQWVVLMSVEDVDLMVGHQANQRILEAVSQRLGLPAGVSHLTVDRHGNTSAASIPLALDDARRSGRLEPGSRVLLTAFGGGLTWGSCVLTWNGTRGEVAVR